MDKAYFLLERYYRMTHIPVRYISLPDGTLLFNCGFEVESDPLLRNVAIIEYVTSKLTPGSLPIVEFEAESIIYGAFLDDLGRCILLGPVCLDDPDSYEMKQYAQDHNIDIAAFKLTPKSFASFGAALTTLFFVFTNNIVSETEIIIGTNEVSLPQPKQESEFLTYALDNIEMDQNHMTYAEEIALMRQIEEGDVEGVQREIQQADLADVERIGKLAKTHQKHFEYMICASLTLITRAAIAGGMEPQAAYDTADVFFQRLEQCNSVSQIVRLHFEARLYYATRVQRLRQERSQYSYIEQCKVFIDNHLSKHFTLEDVATEIGINKSYLSRQFSIAEGVGILHYTQKKRVDAAKNMLKFSNEALPNIASYLCFNSQSHFGKVFKQHTGVTPQKYRDREKLVDYK